jgi:hypothetical protein
MEAVHSSKTLDLHCAETQKINLIKTLRSILVLPCHLHLVFQAVTTSGFLTKIFYTQLSSSMHVKRPACIW